MSITIMKSLFFKLCFLSFFQILKKKLKICTKKDRYLQFGFCVNQTTTHQAENTEFF